MKKEYIKPSMEATELESQVMMAGSDNVVSISNDVTKEDATMGNDRRGGWGNLWD